MIKKKNSKIGTIHYYEMPDNATKQEKFENLNSSKSVKNIEFQEIVPDAKHNWFGKFLDWPKNSIRLISHETKKGERQDAIFRLFSYGGITGKDAILLDFSKDQLREKTEKEISSIYNHQKVVKLLHKPYCVRYLYRDYKQMWSPYLTESIFPRSKK